MRTDVVVRGMGLTCALGDGLRECAAALRSGAPVPAMLELAGFDERIGMPFYSIPETAELFDPLRAGALLPRVAREAIASAGLGADEIARMPIYVGTSAFSIRRSEIRPQVPTELRDAALGLPLLGYEQIARALQRELGSTGETCGFNTACTSAANALLSAWRMIRLGRHRHVLVVGVEIASLPTLAGFSGLQLLADAVKPFDLHRRGIVLGEGIGAIVLSAADEGENGCRLVGGASNLDTYRVTTAHPDGRSVAALLEAMLREAGARVEDILGIKAHGTASPMNDTSEAAGIRRVFHDVPPVCALKAHVGHTLGACGVIETVLMIAALESGFFPATAGFDTLDPALMISPGRSTRDARPGLYVLNYFGFGGHNTALLIEHAA